MNDNNLNLAKEMIELVKSMSDQSNSYEQAVKIINTAGLPGLIVNWFQGYPILSVTNQDSFEIFKGLAMLNQINVNSLSRSINTYRLS